jgi:ribulose-phosphate 3-epimerase
MYIIPAIIPKNQTELTTKVKPLRGVVTHVQVDVCDGVFVKTKTQFHELPFLDEIEYELDLMIDQPEKSIETYIEMQPARIIIHLESVKHIPELFLPLERVRGIIEIGLAINNDTPEERIEPFLEDVDFIQVMGIATIGSQGNSFDERCLERISYLHRKYPHLPLSVDGSVNQETVVRLRDAGATRFVAGSAVFGTKDVVKNIEALEGLLG